jgi:putative ABC transport system ATP-binding protein
MFFIKRNRPDSNTPTSISNKDTVKEGLTPIVQLRDLVKVYLTANGGFKALKGISADFYLGEFVGIVGKSGAGKSTLINMITNTDHITSGEVIVGTVSIHALNENQAALWRGQNLGIIYQNFRLMPSLSLIDNVRLPIDLCGNYVPRLSVERAMELLKEVELEAHAFKPPSDISGGQQQRVAIARALANDPPIIVADEPTGRLDSATADVIVQIFEQLAKRGKLVLMATHDTSLLNRFSRRLTIADGEITEDTGRVTV